MDIDFFSPVVVADPFPWYEEVRAVGRCVRNERAGIWMVTGYNDALTVLRDPHTFSSKLMSGDTFGPWYEGALTMLGADPPQHARLRSVIQRFFTHRATAQREQTVKRLADGLLTEGDVAEKLSKGEPVDVVATLAAPLPVLVIAELLGLPLSDWPRLSQCIDRMALGSVASVVADSEPEARRIEQLSLAAGKELGDYVRDHISARRRQPGRDIVTHLLAITGQGQLTEPEVTATFVLLLLAGGETTAKAISNAIALLAKHPRQRERLRHEPKLLDQAVEEVLRFTGPSQFDPRLVTSDTIIGNAALVEGDVVWLFLPAANRDPTRFRDPHKFDVGRVPNPHLSFGHGIHLCLGAPLAKLEMRIVLRCLLELAPDFESLDVDYGRGFFVRGPISLLLAKPGTKDGSR